MSLRWFFFVFAGLALSWASGVNSGAAQPLDQSASTERMVRVTYPVADLVVPIPGAPGPNKQDALAKALIQVITNTVSRHTWKQADGPGTIEYFPTGMALVVQQSERVHADIARLLAELRRFQDAQVCIETRFVHVSASMAKHLKLDMNEHGKDATARCVSMDEKQANALLKLAQSNESTTITQMPKLTVFNAQRANIAATMSDDAFQLHVQPVVAADKKAVRMALSVRHSWQVEKLPGATTRAGTFVVAPGRTLVWHMGETSRRRHLFALVTPRVLDVEKEERIFLGEAQPILAREGGAEEQSIPAPKKANKKPSAKERAIVERLKQPISMHFKRVPLKQICHDLSVLTDVRVVLDTRALEDARIKLDSPLSISVDNIDMQSALRLMLNKLCLTYTIENDVLMITTQTKGGRLIRTTYKVGDLVAPMPRVEGLESGDTKAEALMDCITRNIDRSSWEDFGGNGTIQYFPKEKTLIISQSQEVHEEIRDVLATLRKLQETNVAVDMQFIQASTEAAKQLRNLMAKQGKKVEAIQVPEETALRWVNRFSAAPNRCKLVRANEPPTFASFDVGPTQEMLEIVRADRACSIIRAPKVSMFNRERVPFECTQKKVVVTEFSTPEHFLPRPDPDAAPHTKIALSKREKIVSGWRCELQPMVSPDRRFVRLSLSVEHFAKDEARSVERITKAALVFNLADQSTLVWDLGATAGGQHLFVLATPRIRVLEDIEAKAPEVELPIPGR